MLSVSGCKPCDKTHSEFNCSAYTLRDLKLLIDRINSQIESEFDKQFNLRYGIGCYNDRSSKKLKSLKASLLRYYEARLGDYTPCLTEQELQNLITNIQINTANYNSAAFLGVEVDDSGLGDWVVDNPTCVAYEQWERAMYIRLPNITPKVTVKECLRFSYDVKVTTPEDKYCEVLYAVNAAHNECQLTSSTIATLKSCNLEVDYNATTHECSITANGNVYDLANLCDLEDIIDDVNLIFPDFTILCALVGSSFTCPDETYHDFLMTIYELDGVDYSGGLPVTVRLDKDPTIDIDWDGTDSGSILFTPYDNNDWTFDDSSPDYYEWRYKTLNFPTLGVKSFNAPIQIIAEPHTSGNSELVPYITEVREDDYTNNSDSESYSYVGCVPDLAMTSLTIDPYVDVTSPSPMYMIPEISEIEGIDTSGDIHVLSPLINYFTINWDPNAVLVNGVAVNNPDWEYLGKIGPLFHYWKYIGDMTGGTVSKIGIEGTWDAGATAGSSGVTFNIFDGSGGETNFLNNSDTVTITWII